jgi:hypothetical protein
MLAAAENKAEVIVKRYAASARGVDTADQNSPALSVKALPKQAASGTPISRPRYTSV